MGSGSATRIRATADGSVGGDRALWHERSATLYQELKRPATAMIRRAFGRAFGDDEIEDVYANAWLGTLRTLERRHTELNDEEIRRYVLAAVANHASKELRRRKRKPIAPLEAAGAVADVTRGPEDSITASETSSVARDVLASLPPRRRAVMLLRYGWGLEPKEVCGLVKGLSPRAYRKEITRGVDELVTKLRLVEAGEWCREREPVLKAYAAGIADADQELQAQRHLEHCRPCADFVGRLSGSLHDIGTAAALPAMVQGLDGTVSFGDRIATGFERLREGVLSSAGRAESLGDTPALVAGTRGAGAAGAGIAAKLAGFGTAGKLALACLGGGAAATACVAAGVVPPLSIGGGEEVRAVERPGGGRPGTEAVVLPSPEPPPVSNPREPGDRGSGGGGSTKREARQEAPEPKAVLEPDTPPVAQEFGVEAAAAAAPSGGGGGSSGGGGDPVAQEFGP